MDEAVIKSELNHWEWVLLKTIPITFNIFLIFGAAYAVLPSEIFNFRTFPLFVFILALPIVNFLLYSLSQFVRGLRGRPVYIGSSEGLIQKQPFQFLAGSLALFIGLFFGATLWYALSLL